MNRLRIDKKPPLQIEGFLKLTSRLPPSHFGCVLG